MNDPDWRQQEELEQREYEEREKSWKEHERYLRDLREIQRDLANGAAEWSANA